MVETLVKHNVVAVQQGLEEIANFLDIRIEETHDFNQLVNEITWECINLGENNTLKRMFSLGEQYDVVEIKQMKEEIMRGHISYTLTKIPKYLKDVAKHLDIDQTRYPSKDQLIQKISTFYEERSSYPFV